LQLCQQYITAKLIRLETSIDDVKRNILKQLDLVHSASTFTVRSCTFISKFSVNKSQILDNAI